LLLYELACSRRRSTCKTVQWFQEEGDGPFVSVFARGTEDTVDAPVAMMSSTTTTVCPG
jgi:hypothetical protein